MWKRSCWTPTRFNRRCTEFLRPLEGGLIPYWENDMNLLTIIIFPSFFFQSPVSLSTSSRHKVYATVFLSSSVLIYDSPLSFSSCQRRFHFACVTSSLSLGAINLSLNYHSRDKLRGPPLSSGSWLVLITLSLPYHTLWSSALSESHCLRQEVRGEERKTPPPPSPVFCATYGSNPFLFSASLHHPSSPFSCLRWPAPPPFSDPVNRPL